MTLAEVDFLGKMRQYDFAIAGESLEVYEFEAEESIFSSFKVNVTIAVRDGLNLNDYIGKEALFTMIGRKTDRYFHGFVSKLTREESRGRYYIYKATVVPSLWKLNLISDVRIFQNQSTKQIVQEVLEGSGIPGNMYEFREHGKYSPREYCVQYRETNMEFISRILAEEGMFYYFEFAENRNMLVIGDMHACHKYIEGTSELLFSPKGRLVNQAEHITHIDYSKNVTSGKVSFRDYHFTNPSYVPSAKKSGSRYDDLELYDYPGQLRDTETEHRLADVALDRAMLKKEVIEGKGICRRLTPGHVFSLTDHPNREFNTEYILTEITHHGKQPQALQELADDNEGNTYGNSFKCITGNTNFRPEKPKKPSVMGVQTAVVTGPAGEEIHVDEHGRIKVQFHWDRLGKKDENTTCWLRVAQPWAGSGWGTVFIPRIGQEVVVSFIDGDPDKPLVTGALYNGANTPPYSLPEEKTKSTIKTNSTKGGGGFNELRFEDKKGSEEIYIHGEKDWNIEILNDKGQDIGHDERLNVVNNRVKTVGVDQSEAIGINKTITVGVDHTESVGSNMFVNIGTNLNESTGENKTVSVGVDQTVSVGQNHTETIGENCTSSTGNDKMITTGNNHTENIGNDLTADIGNNSTVSVGNDSIATYGSNSTVSVGTNLTVDAGGALSTTAAEAISVTSNGSGITITAGGATISITDAGDIVIDGVNISINASGNLTTAGSVISKN